MPRILLLVLLLLPPLGAAANGVRPQTVGLALESFQWEEFYAGERLLREAGLRLTLGLERNGLQRAWPGTVYWLQARAYGGRVGYEGRSQGLDADGQWRSYPLSTDTDYLGGEARMLLGQRLGFTRGGRMLDLYWGLGYRMWLRNIRNGVDLGGRYAVGYREFYRLWEALLGFGLGRLGTARSWIAVGLARPLSVNEWVSLGNVALRPQPRWGAWLHIRMRQGRHNALTVDARLTRLGASPPVGEVFQPQSRAFALAMGWLWHW